MHETYVTIRGNATEDPRTRTTAKGEAMVTFRLASTPYRYDTDQRGFVEGQTSFVSVVAYRALATHLATSVRKGDPLIVHGELQVSTWEQPDGRKGTNVDIRALTAGHDLHRGVSSFTRSRAGEPVRPAAPVVQAPASSPDSAWTSPIDPTAADTDDYVVRSA